eukprot:jgi/Psemu1/289600/fgenesh1_pg.375_\
MVPPGSYSPYNSEATVHLYHAFWGLYLPFSVGTKAAADVYRSYITQRLMKDIGLCVIFRPPMVYRDTERILDLWQSLHFNKFKFIGLGDVEAVREWLAALDTIGYQFPDIPVDIARSSSSGSQQSQEQQQQQQQQQQHRSHSSQLSLYPRPHPQPSMVGGQPFRAFPHINKKLVAKGSIGDEDDQLILKLILQTKDEWPLIKSWVTFPLSQIDPAPFHFKRLYDTMHPFDPGTRGYINPHGHVADDETALRTEFGVLHFHRRCHELEAASVKRALVVDHAYFAESDSDGYVKTNLEERLGLPEHHDICTRTYELNNIDGVDKAVWYLKYLHCPEQVINEYYPEGQEHGTYSDIHEFFQSAEKTFGLNAPP